MIDIKSELIKKSWPPAYFRVPKGAVRKAEGIYNNQLAYNHPLPPPKTGGEVLNEKPEILL